MFGPFAHTPGGFPLTTTLFDENDFRIDKMMILLFVMRVVDSRPSKFRINFDRFKSFLVQQLQRGLTTNEHNALCDCFIAHLSSEMASNEREKTLNAFMNLTFLERKIPTS